MIAFVGVLGLVQDTPVNVTPQVVRDFMPEPQQTSSNTLLSFYFLSKELGQIRRDLI